MAASMAQMTRVMKAVHQMLVNSTAKIKARIGDPRDLRIEPMTRQISWNFHISGLRSTDPEEIARGIQSATQSMFPPYYVVRATVLAGNFYAIQIQENQPNGKAPEQSNQAGPDRSKPAGPIQAQ